MVTREFLVSEARRIGEEVAAKWADEVDRDGRFPAETVAALRTSGLLGAMVPARWGGAGASGSSEVASLSVFSAESFAVLGLVIVGCGGGGG